jgi:hypothetical protein
MVDPEKSHLEQEIKAPRGREQDPDRPQDTAAGPDDFGWNNPATIGAVGQVEQLKRELVRERALKDQLKRKYFIEESDAEISQDFLEGEAEAARDFFNTEEGFEVLKKDVAKYWIEEATPGDPEKENRALHIKGYTDRRRAEEAKARGEEEE